MALFFDYYIILASDWSIPTKHDVKDIIKTFEDYLQVLQTKTSRHQNVNNLEIIYYLRFA